MENAIDYIENTTIATVFLMSSICAIEAWLFSFTLKEKSAADPRRCWMVPSINLATGDSHFPTNLQSGEKSTIQSIYSIDLIK